MGERMAFGKYIRREREGRDMTLTELARRVEVSIHVSPGVLGFLTPS